MDEYIGTKIYLNPGQIPGFTHHYMRLMRFFQRGPHCLCPGESEPRFAGCQCLYILRLARPNMPHLKHDPEAVKS
jgi:hypothetical protein